MIRILLADDHTVLCDGLRILIESQKDMCVVGIAVDGRQAVSMIKEHCPSLVLMDVSMPGLNGIEAARQIHDLCPETHVLMLSMHADMEYVHRALQAGAQGYILKESAGAEVLQAIRTGMAGKPYFSPKITEKMLASLSQDRRGPLESLSDREREVLQLATEGRTSLEIAALLNLSPKTVETYRSRIMTKLDLDSLPALVKFAIQHGLTGLDD
ncbi:MAG: DNA-binding response regulator [Chloroflexi bacterium GWB2_49_20]|nr:MAG: DNA-binding response regulator [Chloroflexi bacterium GWB2_49_20]OGN77523.1 MAG: DNA-binding response regulator [Chloroflexi bacterium GWC2_49_37]OGN83214.1 MAG: DNA-binding response regulator [Chloroflexi bacterium GWD2_49_16]